MMAKEQNITEEQPQETPAVPEVQLAYLVSVGLDGAVNTTPVPVGATLNAFKVQRQATSYDVFQTSKDITSHIESQLLADKVARTVAQMLTQDNYPANLKERILQALDDRGVDVR